MERKWEPRRKESTFHDSFTQVAYNGLMFREEIMEHAEWVAEILQTHPAIANSEAQTKTTLIEPLLHCLGFVPRDPEQVTLEVPTELGGKIDYVLTGEANTKIAVEAKRRGVNLSEKEINQLRSYFTFSEAVAGVLTNGVDYWLFTDLDKTNVMDAAPYHRVDVNHLTDNDIHHLETLTRSQVGQSAVHEQAQRERYRKLVNEIVDQELDSPSQEFLRMVGRKAGISRLSKAHLQLLKPLVREAISRNRTATSHPQQTPRSLPPDVGHKPPPKSSSPTRPDSPSATEPTKRTAGKKAQLTLSRFKGATLLGEDLSAENYRQMLVSVVDKLQNLHPNDFEEWVRKEPFVKKTRKWQYISKDASDFNPSFSRHQAGGYWIDTNLSRKGSVKRARLFLSAFGHDPNELVIYTSD